MSPYFINLIQMSSVLARLESTGNVDYDNENKLYVEGYAQANLYWGLYSSLMFFLGGLLYKAYPSSYDGNSLRSQSPVKYWAWFSYYQLGSWGFAWTFWVLKQLQSENQKIFKIQANTVIAMPLLSILTMLIFFGLIFFGYGDDSLNLGQDKHAGYLAALPILMVNDLLIVKEVYPPTIMKLIKSSGKKQPECFTDDGEKIDCFE